MENYSKVGIIRQLNKPGSSNLIMDMNEILKVKPIGRLPIDALEQLRLLPSVDKRSGILTSLYDEVGELLAGSGIKIDQERSSCRVKPDERIQEKITRRGSADPILDIYAMRLIMENSFKRLAAQVIRERYPTPDIFPWGKPSFRDYSDPEVRRDFARRFNPNIDDWYTATHLNIIFGKGLVVDIAEIQLRTPEEHDLTERKRSEYLESQKNLTASINQALT